MEIIIKDVTIENEWDYQRAYLLLKLQGLDGRTMTVEQRDILEKKVTEYMWSEIVKRYPKIAECCTSKTGMFNKAEARHYGTPIISIHGSFYMQLVTMSDNDSWMWESINLQPYRFYFNDEWYFERQITEAIGKAVLEQGPEVIPRFKKLLSKLDIKLPYHLEKLVPSDE